MTNPDDDYVYDEASGEWRPASEVATSQAQAIEVRNASGTLLADGDSVVLIKDLKVKGAGQTLKQGTGHQVDPADLQPRRDRLPARRDQGPGPAHGVRAQALVVVQPLRAVCQLVREKSKPCLKA